MHDLNSQWQSESLSQLIKFV